MNKKMIAMASILALAGMVQAATVSYENTVSQSYSTPISVTVQQFNNISGAYAGATLNSVTLSLVSAKESANVTIQNNDNVADDVEVYFSGALKFGTTGTGGKSTTAGLSFDDTYSVAANSVWGPTKLTTGVGTASQEFDSGLNSFIGTGNVGNMKISLLVTPPYSGWGGAGYLDGSTGASGNTIDASWKVTYDYTPEVPVPEPASMALFGVGGLVVALRRRYGKNKKA